MRTLAIAASILVLAACGKQSSETQPSAINSKPTESAATVKSKASEPSQTQTKWDGPFGVKMGLTVAELEQAGIKLIKGKSPGVYISESAPSPNQKFTLYRYVIGEKAGLCQITGITPAIEANDAGDQVKEAFTALEEALTEKYGNPEKLQYVKKDALFKESKYWMMALKRQERVHVSAWPGKNADALPFSLEAIALEATADSSTSGELDLGYEFSNADSCVNESKKKANASL